MGKGVVFKQRYKSSNLPSTPVLNVKHLNYIATRKGAIHNPGCSFGLWGRFPGQVGPEDMNNLKLAREAVKQASQAHTIYRVVISVDDETAQRHDLYARGTWQKLITEKVGVLAKEMDIAPKDFCWAASMHYAKGHPHVHIMYWDNSSKVRQEYVPPERFEIITEHVRSTFGREIYQEELAELRTEAKELVSTVRLELQAMCREANLEQSLNLNNISVAKLDKLGQAFAALALDLPRKGALKYAYLPDEYKAQMDEFLGKIIEITDFKRLAGKYEQLTDQISDLYGNGKEKKAYNQEQAHKKLYTDMGNSVLTVLKEYRQALEASAPSDIAQLKSVICRDTLAILQHAPQYKELQNLFPRERTPIPAVLASPAFREKLSKLTDEISGDIRIRSRVKGHINAAIKQTKDETADKKAFAHKVHRDLEKAIKGVVLDKLQEDAGYDQQRQTDAVTTLILQLFRMGSQGAGQLQSQHDLLRSKSHDLSKTALRDVQKQKEQEGNWTLE